MSLWLNKTRYIKFQYFTLPNLVQFEYEEPNSRKSPGKHSIADNSNKAIGLVRVPFYMTMRIMPNQQSCFSTWANKIRDYRVLADRLGERIGSLNFLSHYPVFKGRSSQACNYSNHPLPRYCRRYNLFRTECRAGECPTIIQVEFIILIAG